jgi:hypothetical protein
VTGEISHMQTSVTNRITSARLVIRTQTHSSETPPRIKTNTCETKRKQTNTTLPSLLALRTALVRILCNILYLTILAICSMIGSLIVTA